MVSSNMTRRELTNKCREIRDNNKWKTLNEEDFNFLMTEIFPYHDKWEEKKGCGVKSIIVRITEPYKNFGFYLVRKDGTMTDISYTWPIANRPDELCK